jgi:hypothetical protein
MNNIFSEFQKLCKDSLTAPNGKYSSAKIILMFGFMIASLVLWKALILGNLSIEFFVAYLAFISGHNNISKFLDTKIISNEPKDKENDK